MNTQKNWTRLLAVLLALAVLLPSAGMAQAGKPEGSVKDHYIVVFKENVDINSSAPEMEANYGLTVSHVYRHALKGMAVYIPAGRLNALQHDPRVAYVVEDLIRTVGGQTNPTGIQRVFADDNTNIDIDGADDYRVDVDVAIIDTGIDLEHTDLNVVSSTSCMNTSGGGPPWSREYYCGEGGDDDHYHGTHVAGSVAALDNGFGVVGVAPGARLWAVKVCDAQGSCPSSAIIAGIDYVAGNAGSIEVANMSLGGSGFSQAEYDAIQGAVDAGVAFAVAAGNDDDDANNYSPAAFDNVLTVSALADFDGEPGGNGSPTCRDDQDDTLADFSNWGDAVQIAAPGVCIYSTFPIEEGEYGTISGTSMASPHAAGGLALLASSSNPGNATDVYNLYDQVINAGNFDWTDDSGDGIQEPLLDVSTFTPVLIETGGTTDNPPTVSITNPVDGATVSDVVSVTADTSDDNGVGQVEFFVDGSSIGIDNDGSDGYSVSWDTTAYAVGGHTIEAVATDTAGQTASDSISVTVDNGTADNPPSVSITNPAEGATVSGTVSVTADAADDNGVSKVEFFVDGGSIGTDSDGNDGWSVDWDTSTVSDGDHTVKAVATDSADQTASDSISVTVDNSGGTTDPIELSVSAYKVRGTQYADLTWNGAASTYVDIYRDGSVVVTTDNDGFHTDTTGQVGGGSATYQVCEAGTTTCSNEVTATW